MSYTVIDRNWHELYIVVAKSCCAFHSKAVTSCGSLQSGKGVPPPVALVACRNARCFVSTITHIITIHHGNTWWTQSSAKWESNQKPQDLAIGYHALHTGLVETGHRYVMNKI